MRVRIVLLLTICVLLSFNTPASAAKRMALLIGNANYRHYPLGNPLNDVRLLANALDHLGFNVFPIVRDASKGQIEAAIYDFVSKSNDAELLFFFYAGHGYSYNGKSFLMPVGAKMKTKADYEDRSVNLSWILRQLHHDNEAQRVVIVDTCRNSRGPGAYEDFLINPPTSGTLMSFSASSQERVSDGPRDSNSYFVKNLVKHIGERKSLQEIFIDVRNGVQEDTYGNQNPVETSKLREPIYLAGKPALASDTTKNFRQKWSPPGIKHSAGEEWIHPGTGIEFVWVPGGCYMMGSYSGRTEEQPLHEVCVDGFWMSKYEITTGQYRKYEKNHNLRLHKGMPVDRNSQPVVNVSWEEATAFGEWMSSKKYGTIRLATEAEWEWGARAGSSGENYWGETLANACSHANVADKSPKLRGLRVYARGTKIFPCNDHAIVPTDVHRTKANSYGLHGMLGNVAEWCQDTYSRNAYSAHSPGNPVDMEGSGHVIRGGAWNDSPGDVSFTRRKRGTVGLDVGFRLVRIE